MHRFATRVRLGHRLIRGLLAMLALLALNMQSMRHYEPRMLLGASLCATSPDDTSDSGNLSQGMGCGLCCAAPHTPAVPANSIAFEPALFATDAVPARALAAQTRAPTWQPGRPRGPPRTA